MPYIKEDTRHSIRSVVHHLAEVIDELPTEQMDGMANYAITELVLELYTRDNYLELQTAIGLLECVKQEFYRRAVAPYEDMKIKQNGDVY